MPKIPLMSPKPFSGDKEKEENLDTWVSIVPTYVRHKLTRPEQEVVVAASFLEGSAARWLNGLVQQQGYGQDFDAWAQSQTLEQFVRSVYNRWNDPQGAQKATDAINNLCSRRFKDVRELTDTVERLLVVPGVRFDPQVLLTDYLRCLPTEVRTKLVDEAYINQHTFASFRKKARDIEAKLGSAHKASNDGRKRLPQDWKKKLMFVDHDGQTTEIDDYSDLGEFTEHDGGGETSDGGVVAPIEEKARGTGKKKVVRSTGQGDQGTPAWVKIGLEYEHAMNKIFHDYLDKFIVVYLNDILIFSRTVEEHAEHLKIVLGLLRQHQYKVNLDKCEFRRTKILYLGHEISADGLRPEDAKVASIRDWPRPQTVIEVISFLGITGYYRPFVKNYSTIASPLTDLTRLDTPWKWTEECEASFKKLKYALTHYEVLKLPDPDKPFVVTTDASQYGIGAVLAQQEGPKLRPIEYMSKKMPSEKLAKSTYERELYALYRALVHWRHYLLGRFFYVRSDHETLRWIKAQPVLSDALKRWIQVIDMYDSQLDPIKCTYNKVVDALSRRADYLGALVIEFGISNDLTRSLVEAYQGDPVMSEIIRRFKAKDKKTLDEFTMVDDLLFLDKAGKIVCPK
ncbi:hypothetical protein CBR_g50596 [Chara braunii]|uniref:Reverse transcriptase domain-containing protein n=1 Tax=Chara braunii TaxID=69332 RepID=A0A388M6Y3_CHABU|nr:hypothetical protein CBR_g50596 [Chara braunii]|eukprot:GBG90348.1 hypothetical protein CBR_g50596 [Chara braunii]